MSFLVWGRPHEDAFILFRYCKNLAAGQGIVFYPGGPHAEGATDFLWMVAVTSVHRLGIDVALAALVLNSLGFYIAAQILLSSWPRSWPFRLAVVLQLASPLALAGYVGFSVTLYSSISLALLALYVRGRILLIPAIALLLGLLRPDGVIIGIVFTVLGLIDAWRTQKTRPFLATSAICLLVGTGYFLWRWHYFGLPLPLPLYVKSHYTQSFPGLFGILDFLLACVLPPALVGIGAPWLLGRSNAPTRRLLVGFLPFLVHLASFVFSIHSQNVANRFQAPAALAAVFIAYSLIAGNLTRRRQLALSGMAIAAFLPLVPIARSAWHDGFEHDYLPRFAHDLGAILPPTRRIALTEAGQIPFWTEASALDLVGLNAPETAQRPPTADLLKRFDPDMLMLHPAGSLDESRIDDGSGQDVIPIRIPIREAVHPHLRNLLSTDLPDYRQLGEENVRIAPLATWAIVGDDPHYEFYAVRYKGSYGRFHIYAFRRGLPERDAILELLRKAHTESPKGYWTLRSSKTPT